ncbi:MAG: hypothetical protein A3I88_02845 [Candidatus Portnoybacteria bacterium RIFCSPLOWO2_12_FULL_39_9]|uniref:Uncharacterized protein n=1 Tax=Candidatus Portnoybacteria bacterium RIFCSPHIGHO2_12_FULL_38_9 TaxID=1801997 RepID=A0A1G2FIA0_9BACT|nr:MAG: hypothetical protein A2646_01720 [Candidatus Portnoybacteria bacterium RIFCSPHIGHO2_02_FULL_39_12]OGZ37567.1 MAG: hypothetical protein A3J64_02060 [Candidatus Portnoybacteria bacterium RIFCSPHIGHO2_12_FULL_38_9]OGZ38643.1 MAG: hypothetical protein A3F21_02150 [Candidatus Portnoybacteria bacterium RIFCSPLOWO2_01_FULL_38_39]OGZ41245.1 MAG: hypothetical protein A3I88_02845 [Candidatus Portnoybacteria bacterium RIFCSPLOWO2_12_FULL_39_9]
MFAAEPIIFATSIPSRAQRGEDRIPFELFLEYSANFQIATFGRLLPRFNITVGTRQPILGAKLNFLSFKLYSILYLKNSIKNDII